MTAGPSAPGAGPRENQPAKAGSCGTSIDPATSSPRSTNSDRTPRLGTDIATGWDSGSTKPVVRSRTSSRLVLGVGRTGVGVDALGVADMLCPFGPPGRAESGVDGLLALPTPGLRRLWPVPRR